MTINWQDVITNLAVVTGGGTVLVGASAWLIKTVITQRLTTEAEAFKAKIQADANVEIERLKNSLQIVATEHQVRFTKLHEKRAEIIADLYKQLVDLEYHADEFSVISEMTTREEFNVLQQEMHELREFYEQNQIYLPLEVSRALAGLLSHISKNVWTARYSDQSDERRVEAIASFGGKIPEARKSLENEFRKMLGVESDSV